MNKVFQALADPTRRMILKMLNEGDLTAGQISEQFEMSKPSITHHLNILKNADLVQSEKVGQFVIYSLNTTVFQDVVGWFFDFTNRGDHDESK
ncbi:MAG: autorepressor SdpR family transcription factor [Turicibacter sp.]